MSRYTWLLLLAAAGLACSDDSGAGPTEPVASVQVDPDAWDLRAGESLQLRATPRDRNQRPLQGRAVAWSSSSPAVATVSPSGMVVAHDAGIVIITAASEGKEGRATVRVDRPAAAFDLVYSGSGSSTGLPRLYLVRLGGAPELLLSPHVLPGWGLRSPAPSPDGRRIAFAAERGADAFVYVVDADGGNLRRLTDGGDEAQPTWSPDGTRIAFVSWPPGPDADIWVMNADGSNPVNLTGHMGYTDQHSPAWSPEMPGGSRIAFSDGGYEGGRILTMRPDGQDAREVTAQGDHLDAEPTWSPDGSRIVFVRQAASGTDLWVVGATGADPRPLVVLPATQANPAWSPDGRLVAFSSIHEPGSLFDVYTVSSDGADLVRRSGGTAYGVHPAWKARF